MSWSFRFVGKSEDVAAAVKKHVDQNKQYSSPQGVDMVPVYDALHTLSDALITQFPGRTVSVDSSGHVDPYAGLCNIKIELYPNLEPAQTS